MLGRGPDILPSEKIASHFNIATCVKWEKEIEMVIERNKLRSKMSDLQLEWIRNGNWWKFSKKSFLRARILNCPPKYHRIKADNLI